MSEYDLFTTPDLYDGKSVNNVVSGIVAFGRLSQKLGFAGPTIGLCLVEGPPAAIAATAAAAALTAGERWSKRGRESRERDGGHWPRLLDAF